MAGSFRVPFLMAAATLTLSILNTVQTLRTKKEQWSRMVENIHVILCTIVHLHSDLGVDDVLPPNVLHSLAGFTESLTKINTYAKSQQETGRLQQLFRQFDAKARYETCQQELQHWTRIFQIHANAETVSGVNQIHLSAQERHEELLALLKLHPELTASETMSSVNMLD
ncbi:hypothetical protein MVEN_02211500 [Mycena venus]|uniref:Uncharacterized protein n=1 Tax=Mycena venus TaxID=2733690 RepID=A0A8H7CFB9_9AGAR|nr:hypothetical protein MVEN_02211500 [Mycena venus]